MLCKEDIKIELSCQQYQYEGYMENEDGTAAVAMLRSQRKTEDVHCPFCNGKVNIWAETSKYLRDIPFRAEVRQDISFICHRYRCTVCRRKHTEDIPFQYPGTRITKRAAEWVKALLRNKVSIKTVQSITRIHWETIRNIHIGMMEDTLEKHTRELKAAGYKPLFLAVDEFAIHKGHTYATSVMDLETGEVLWVGKGRSKDDFRKFFEEVEPTFITDIKAIAMDMNASYHIVVKEMLPHAQIVYDRYHMQAQYGRDVLGVVRLEEARKHKAASQALRNELSHSTGEEKAEIKKKVSLEKHRYHAIKNLRWTLLTNGEKLSETQSSNLQEILDNHSDLAVCYAMKEEMISLFQLRDTAEAEKRWRCWFDAAKNSGIPALIRFAELKEMRIHGLVAHALYPISTGKLEGFNNKIKVAKRVGYGFRDDFYFFLLVRSLSLHPTNP